MSDQGIGAISRFEDPLKDTIAGYLSGGRADHVVALAPSAESMLMSKMRDPMAAVLGGYALLRLNELERLHDWPDNLAAWFEWLPDGSVIAGELAARQGRDEDAAAHMATAARRGVPVLSEGLSLFASRVPQLTADPDVTAASREALQQARRSPVATSAGFRALTTTLMIDPSTLGGGDDAGWVALTCRIHQAPRPTTGSDERRDLHVSRPSSRHRLTQSSSTTAMTSPLIAS